MKHAEHTYDSSVLITTSIINTTNNNISIKYSTLGTIVIMLSAVFLGNGLYPRKAHWHVPEAMGCLKRSIAGDS